MLGGSIYQHLDLIYAVAWWVTVSSLIARLVLRESLRDVSFGWGGRAGSRAMIVATILPPIVGFLSYGLAWNIGLAQFHPPDVSDQVYGMHLAGTSAIHFLKYLAVMLTVGCVDLLRYTAGEEIGWRGYMVTRLRDSGVFAPILLSGLVWALWHMPLILTGQYSSGPRPVLSALVFTVDIMALGAVFAWFRFTSGSVWPCIWGHAVWNNVIEGTFDNFTGGYSIWVGESGILCAVATTALALLLYRVWPVPNATPIEPR